MCWQCSGARPPAGRARSSPHYGALICPAHPVQLLAVVQAWAHLRGPFSRVQAGAAEESHSVRSPIGWEGGVGGDVTGVGITRASSGSAPSLTAPKPLLLLPSGTASPPGPLPHLLGRGDFSFLARRSSSFSEPKSSRKSSRSLSAALCQLQRQACAVPMASRTTPRAPFHQRPERAMGPGITPPPLISARKPEP